MTGQLSPHCQVTANFCLDARSRATRGLSSKPAPINLGQGVENVENPAGRMERHCGALSKRRVDQQNCPSYGCTPPAIHYILKRNRLRSSEILAEPMQIRTAVQSQARLVRANTPDPPPASTPHGENFGNGAAGLNMLRASAPDPAPSTPTAAAPVPMMTAPAPSSTLARLPDLAGKPADRAAAPTPALPGLDSELHLRAEAAIETFRSSLDAALDRGFAAVYACGCGRRRRI